MCPPTRTPNHGSFGRPMPVAVHPRYPDDQPRGMKQPPSTGGAGRIRWLVYWMHRPPYVRWATGALLLLGALSWDLRSGATVQHPYAARPIAAGEAISADDVEWRVVDARVLPQVALGGMVAMVDVPAGSPFTPPLVGPARDVPDGWWAVPITLGAYAATGAEVMLVLSDPPRTIAGLVIASQHGDPFTLDFSPAVVAVPGPDAAAAARASADGTLVAAVRP